MARKFKTPITIDELGSASSQALAANVDGDSQNRINIDAGGKITWGSGSATGDTTLYRSTADTLKTDDAFTATSLAVTGQFTFPTSDGSADQIMVTDGSGGVTWENNTATASPAGSDGQVQYNNGGSAGGASGLIYDDTNNRVGIGTTSPQNELHIQDGSSGATADSGTYTQLVVEDSTNAGIHLMSPDTGVGRVLMGTPSRQFGSLMRWDYPNRTYDIGTDEASGEIALRTGNFVERMRIDSSGNVGIGTTSPSDLLHINAGTSGAIKIGTTGGRIAELTANDSGQFLSVGSTSSHAFALMTNGSRRLTVDSSGNVGINDTTPSYQLDVNGTVRSVGTLTAGGGIDGLTLANGGIAGSNYNITGVNQMTINDSGEGIAWPNVTMYQEDGDTDRLTLNGNLLLKATAGPNITIRDTDSTNASGYIAFEKSDGTRMGYVGYPNNDDLHIKNEDAGGHVYFSTSNATRMIVNSSGNVGIGLTGPENKLHVYQTGFSPSSNDDASIQVEGSWGGGITFAEGNNRTMIYSPSGNAFRVRVGATASGGGTEALTIDNAGTVTIPGQLNCSHLRSDGTTQYFGPSGSWEMYLTSAGLYPYTNNGAALGSTSRYWNGVYSQNWFRSTGDTGWYSQTYGGGIYMTDTTWVKTYGSKGLQSMGGFAIQAPNTTTTYSGYQDLLWNTTWTSVHRYSSKRSMKEQIEPLNASVDAGAVIDLLKPVSFIAAPNPDNEEPETPAEKEMREADLVWGFVAEDVCEIDETTGARLGVYEPSEDGDGFQPSAWAQRAFFPLLVAELQGLRKRVAQLEDRALDRIDELEARLDLLENN